MKEIKQLILAGLLFLIVVSLFLMPKPVVWAAAPFSLDEVVRHLQQVYENTADFKASFIQETTVKSIKKTDIEEGTVFFKNPRYMLWNYSKPKPKKLIINPQKAWLYLPAEKVAYTQEADYIFRSKVLIKFLSGLGKLKDDFTIKFSEPKTLDKDGNYLLILTPLEKNSGLNDIKITVDKDNFFIMQVYFDDLLGNSTVLRFSNVIMNSGLSGKLFQFKPPAGVSIFNMP
jgi:outer membrane lipoprotein carrier protein